jgi:nucleotide-binding universal stress UspA family protein
MLVEQARGDQPMAALEFRRILCPVDFSEASAGALRAAASLASRFDASLTLLHVAVIPGSAIPEAMLPTPAELATDHSAPADRPLLEWKAQAERLGARRVQAFRSVGQPAQEIVALAGRDAFDLVVIGTHGRTGLGHLLLGSVAEEVVRRAPCPVLTVGSAASQALAG